MEMHGNLTTPDGMFVPGTGDQGRDYDMPDRLSSKIAVGICNLFGMPYYKSALGNNMGKFANFSVLGQSDYQNQFDSKYGTYTEQKQACFKAGSQIMKNADVSFSTSNPISTATENSDHSKLVITNNAKTGVDYIKQQLENGNPVFAGVNHTLGLGYNSNYNNATDDHFIVIKGSGYDSEKKQNYFNFYEVGAPDNTSGTDDKNRLYLDPSTNALTGSPVYNSNRKYTVSDIFKNN